MRLFFLLTLIMAFATILQAQDEVIKDIQNVTTREIAKDSVPTFGWKKGGTFSLKVGQGGSSNWAAGAEKFSFTFASYLTVFANKESKRSYWYNSLELGFGLVSTTSQGVRKTDDKIDYFTRFGRKINDKWSFSGIFNFRSQFADGFTFDYLGKGLQRRISGLFAPAYITAAPGFDWKPTKGFSIFMTPLAARWVIVSNRPYSFLFPGGIDPNTGIAERPLAEYYGVDATRGVDFQLGAFVSASYKNEIIKNVAYTGRLDLYSNYLKPSLPNGQGLREARPQNVDVFWANAFLMKVNKYLSVTYNFDLIYDDDVRQFGPNRTSPGTQLRSLLGVGFTAKF